MSACGVGATFDAATFWDHCAQHEECWYDDAQELPPVGTVIDRARGLFQDGYAGMWIDRSGPKSVYRVGVARATDGDRAEWSAAWHGNPRVLLVGQRYGAGEIRRFRGVAERILSGHLRQHALGQSDQENRLEINLYPRPAEFAEAEEIRRELAVALPEDAYLLTIEDGTPSTTVEPADWYLIGADGPVLTVGVAFGGCSAPDHVEASERPGEVWVGAFDLHTRTPGYGCALALGCARSQVTLAEPLGNRRLRHASVPKENRVPDGWGTDDRGSAPPPGLATC